MKITFTIILALAFFSAQSQSIVGTWQLVEQTTCLDGELVPDDEETAELTEEMKSMSSGGTNRMITFKDNMSGAENVKIFDSRKASKMNNFLYKFDGDRLYILDKKSRLLIGSYQVEELSADSLIFTNLKRACETRVFIRIQDK